MVSQAPASVTGVQGLYQVNSAAPKQSDQVSSLKSLKVKLREALGGRGFGGFRSERCASIGSCKLRDWVLAGIYASLGFALYRCWSSC